MAKVKKMKRGEPPKRPKLKVKPKVQKSKGAPTPKANSAGSKVPVKAEVVRKAVDEKKIQVITITDSPLKMKEKTPKKGKAAVKNLDVVAAASSLSLGVKGKAKGKKKVAEKSIANMLVDDLNSLKEVGKFSRAILLKDYERPIAVPATSSNLNVETKDEIESEKSAGIKVNKKTPKKMGTQSKTKVVKKGSRTPSHSSVDVKKSPQNQNKAHLGTPTPSIPKVKKLKKTTVPIPFLDVKTKSEGEIMANYGEKEQNPPKGKAKDTEIASRPGPSIDVQIEDESTTTNAVDEKKRAVNKKPKSFKSKAKARKQPKKPSPALISSAKKTTKLAKKSNTQALNLEDVNGDVKALNENKNIKKKRTLIKAAKMQASVYPTPTPPPKKRMMKSPKMGKNSMEMETVVSVFDIKTKSESEIGANVDEKEQNPPKRLKGNAKGTKQANRPGPSIDALVKIEDMSIAKAADSIDEKKSAANKTTKSLRSNAKIGKQPKNLSPPQNPIAKPSKRKRRTKVAKKSNARALKLDNVKTVNEKKSNKKKNTYKAAKMQPSVYPTDNHSDDVDDYATGQNLNPPPCSLDIVDSLENWSNSEEEERSRLYENLDVGQNYRQILEDSLMVLNLANCEKNALSDHHGMADNYLKIEKSHEKYVQSITEITIKNNAELEETMAELKSRYDDLMDLYKSLNMKLQAQANPSNQEALSAKNYEEKDSTIKSEAKKRIDVLKLKLGKLQKTYNWYRKQLKIKNGMSPQKLTGGVNKIQKRKVKKELKNKAKKNDGHSSDESSDIGFEDKIKTFNGSKKGPLASDSMKLINFPDKLDCPSKMPSASAVDSSDDESVMTIDEKKATETTDSVSVRQQIHEMLDNEIRSSGVHQVVKLSLIKDVNKSESSSNPTIMPINKVSSGGEIEMKRTSSFIFSSGSDDESDGNNEDKSQGNESEDQIGATEEMVISELEETRVIGGKRAFEVNDDEAGSSNNETKRNKVDTTTNTITSSDSVAVGPTKNVVSITKRSVPASLLEDLSDTESEILAVLDRKKKFDAERKKNLT